MHMGDKHLDEDKIRERAYLIWEREGRPHGQHDQHWNQARWELLSEHEIASPADGDAGKTTAKKAPRKAAPRTKTATAKAAGAEAKPKTAKPRATKPKAATAAKPTGEAKTARTTKRSTGAGKAD